MTTTPLESFPPMNQWDDWVEYDPAAWPRKVEKRYILVPTTCFNCEAACGLVAYVEKGAAGESKDASTRSEDASGGARSSRPLASSLPQLKITKLEGNPHHPASRGRNCAKGPATLNQVHDPNRILYPLKRIGPRGSGRFERTTWDEVLDTFAARIRKALIENRRTEIMYHVGRPGHDGYMDRVLQAWGVDGHNSHTNVCSSAARVGYALWTGADRPSPDHANAKFILMLSAHLETGHYFNPHAQRIIEGKNNGAKICVIDVRLSNTASMADYWLAPWPGTEAMLLLAIAHVLLNENLFNRQYVQQWVNWRDYMRVKAPSEPIDFDRFIEHLKAHYAYATPEAAERECGIPAAQIRTIAREIGAAGPALATHVWRNAAAGNLGGWQVARCLQFIVVLMGAVNTPGGTHLNSNNKFVPPPFLKPPPQNVWSELLYPPEYPLAYHELSYLLPHFLEEGRGKVDVYFTRVYNPVWTNPDGMMWEKMLRDESRIGLHAALTPVWSETAQYADYVLPMGNGAERHDLMSQETHAARWISFRQPVLRVAAERLGKSVEFTFQANPGEVWEEDEFWIELSWRIDPDGSLGVRKYFESPYRAGAKITVEEYYRWIFENSVPGLPEAAKTLGLTPLEYMKRHGAFLVEADTYTGHLAKLKAEQTQGAETREDGSVVKDGTPIGVRHGDHAAIGFNTPSRKLELYSDTMPQWGWPEYDLPAYIESHIHRKHMDRSKGEYVLIPTFRLPTLIHTRSANAKWLYEHSNTNPVWMHPEDAVMLGVQTTDLIRVATRIGYFINKVWVTEGMRPGVLACSHHLGRWRLFDNGGADRMAACKVVREEIAPGQFRFRKIEKIRAYASSDPDTKRIWWSDGGVHQNLTFPVQPDPISGQHCWHQAVMISRAGSGDEYGDVFVDTNKSMEVYREWLARTRPGPGPGGLRRPLWFARAVRPSAQAFRTKK